MAKVERSTMCRKDNFLDLNVTKTKDLVIDLGKQPLSVQPIKIDCGIV